MKIVILDSYTVNPGDLSWDSLYTFGDLTVYDRTSSSDIIPRISEADIVLTSKCILSKEVMDSCKNLKYIGVLATGYNNIDLAHAEKKGIAVTYIPAYSTDSVAQFVFSLLLEVCNKVQRHNTAVRQGDWHASEDFCFTVTPQIELAGKTLGIVGYGNIGRRVAKIAEAFGMNVLIATRYPDPGFATDQITFDSQDDLLARADVISLHCPLTDENRGFINRNAISKMKDGVIIINTSRGPLVNEPDLADALDSGKVAAACLDVLEKEPPQEATHRLIEHPNCIVTPHIAWITKEARSRLIEIATANLKAYLAGRTLNRIK